MGNWYRRISLFILMSLNFLAAPWCGAAQNSSAGSSVAHPPSKPRKSAPADSALDAGSVSNGVYRNKTLGLSCKIPAGWVLRTEELNAGEGSNPDHGASPQGARASGGRVLLAAFSRPPEAKGEDVNSSILIAAEMVAAYPGLKEAAQYFEPLTEVAKAQGFTVDREPYEFPVGARTLVRVDFHKDVGKLVMRQASLAMLAHGYAVSITVIGGTEDEVEGLVDSLNFGPSVPSAKE